MEIAQVLMVIEIVLSVLLVVAIVLQPKDADAGTLFGGGFAEEVKRTKRGFELFLHNATIVLLVFWIAIAIAIMLINGQAGLY